MTNKSKVMSSSVDAKESEMMEQCLVVFAYEASNPDELSLKEGQIVSVLSRKTDDPGWWRGRVDNKTGVFPDNFVRMVKRSNNVFTRAKVEGQEKSEVELTKQLEKEEGSKKEESSKKEAAKVRLRRSEESTLTSSPIDDMETSTKRLSHPTASRARVPKRRPPSALFLKESKEHEKNKEKVEKDSSNTQEKKDKSSKVEAAILEVAKMEDALRKEAEKKVRKTPPPKPPPPKTTTTASTTTTTTTTTSTSTTTTTTTSTTPTTPTSSPKTTKRPEWLAELSRKQANRRSGGHLLTVSNNVTKTDEPDAVSNPVDNVKMENGKNVGRVASMRQTFVASPTSEAAISNNGTNSTLKEIEVPKISIWEKVERLAERLENTEHLLRSEIGRLEHELKEESSARRNLQHQIEQLSKHVSNHVTKM